MRVSIPCTTDGTKQENGEIPLQNYITSLRLSYGEPWHTIIQATM